MNSIKILSPAKLNLDLYIIDKRDDDYHNISSLMQPINIYDEIKIEISDSEDAISLNFPDDIVSFEENLITKAALKFLDSFKITNHLNISVKKRIPVGSGMGGGSSNAASVLIGLSKLFSIDAFDTLKKIAIQLGSDVPFFLYSRTARVSGRGELVEPYRINEKLKYLLIFPGIVSKTKLLYKLWDESNSFLGDDEKQRINPFIKKHIFIDNKKFILQNDFTPLLIMQDKKYLDIFMLLKELGLDAYSVSGSGSTIFCLLDNKKNYSETIRYLQSNQDFSTCLVETFEGWHFSYD